jgi:hypothetical protein
VVLHTYLFEVGVQRVHRLGSQEVAPFRGARRTNQL